MDLPSAFAGLLAGGAAASLAAFALDRRRQSALDALRTRVAESEAAERVARAALYSDNADLRRRIEAVADAVLARKG